MLVKDAMTKHVFTLRADKKALAAQEIMEWAHVRHVPIVDHLGQLVGMVSRVGLLKAAMAHISSRVKVEAEQQLSMIPLDLVWERDIRTISPDATVRDAAWMMRAEKLSGLPVVEGKRLVGILTDYDLLRVLEEPSGVQPFTSGEAARS